MEHKIYYNDSKNWLLKSLDALYKNISGDVRYIDGVEGIAYYEILAVVEDRITNLKRCIEAFE